MLERFALAPAALLALATLAVACAPAAVEPEEERGGTTQHEYTTGVDAKLSGNSAYFKAVRIGGATADHPVIMEADGTLVVCEKEARQSDDGKRLLNAMVNFSGQLDDVYGVVERMDLDQDNPSRLSAKSYQAPYLDPQYSYCGEINEGGGRSQPGYRLQPTERPVSSSLIKSMSLETTLKALVEGNLGKMKCEGSLEGSGLGVEPRFQSFHIEGGQIAPPKLDFRVYGSASITSSGKCSLSASKSMVFLAGYVPVYLEISASVSLGLEGNLQGPFDISTDGSSIPVIPESSSFTFRPEIEVGIKLYKVVGGSVTVSVPLTIEHQASCSPSVTVTPQVKFAAEAGIGPFSVERSATLGTPITLRSATCNAPSAAAAAAAAAVGGAPECFCYGAKGPGDVDVGPVACGGQVCGADNQYWQCNNDGTLSVAGSACN